MDAVAVVTAIFVDGDRILACRRHRHRQAGGRWEFPGGKLETGERPEDALRREINEELAIDIEVGELFDRSRTVAEGRLVTLACYLAQPLERLPLTSADHDIVAWFDRRQLGWLDWAGPDLPAVRRLTDVKV